ncbi:MAG: glycosyltransferase family 2 protein [Pseudomonadota bacterium]
MFSSIIITTYNRPEALNMVLRALNKQKNKKFEVIVADDGSDKDTQLMISALENKLDFRIRHVWHEDNGFRAAEIRNKAVLKSTGDYLIFLDGDCIPLPDFIVSHARLSEKGWFIRGNRILLSKKFTNDALSTNIKIYKWPKHYWIKQRLLNNIKRIIPLVSMPNSKLRKIRKKQWVGVKTCNLGVWKKDFVAINGFDENYQGWGREDSDLAVRLINNNINRKEGTFATGVLHLWHKANSRENFEKNDLQLEKTIKNESTWAETGYSRHIQQNNIN